MAEGTNIGAAHPVSGTGEDITGDMRTKALNDITSFMRSLAEKRGRNIDEAVLAITESKSFTATEALEAGIIDAIIPNDETLLITLAEKLEIESLSRVDFEPNLTERLSFFLANPNTLMLLLFIGMLMIFLEFKMPGSFVFAGIGIVAFVIFLFGINLLPINLLGLILILLGIGLIVAEVFVASFGLLAVAGLVSLIMGARLLFDTANVEGIAVSMSLLVTLSGTVGLAIILIGRLIAKDFARKRVSGVDGLVGTPALVLRWEEGAGKVDLHGEIWSAVSEDDIAEGDTVEVLSSSGLTLTVKK
jgi:membrane-bound serine protease (ClpP class)